MKSFTIDTNIAIGVLNPKDRLHDRSVNLLREKSRGRELIIINLVLIETKHTFTRKYNKAVSKIIRILRDLDKQKLDDLEYNRKFTNEMSNLINTEGNLRGFLTFCYELCKGFVNKRDTQEVFTFLSEKGLGHLAWIDTIIQREANDNCSLAKFKKEEYTHVNSISEIIDDIYFQDQMDKSLFLHCIALSFSREMDLLLFTDDSEFIDKGKQSIEVLAKNKTYRHHKLNIKKLP